MEIITEAIVLRSTKYTSSSFIVNAFSREAGLIAFIFRASKKQKTMALKELLTIVELNYTYKENKAIITPRNLSISQPLPSITMSFHKQTMSMFIAEFMGKMIQEEEQNREFFDFFKQALIELNDTDEPKAFHIWFVIQCTHYLGISPSIGDGLFLDLESGRGSDFEPPHHFYLDKHQTQIFKSFLTSKHYYNLSKFDFNHSELLNQVLTYYKIHVEAFKELRSLAVLEDLYDSFRKK